MSARDPVERLAQEFSRLPGIGLRSATRLAFYVLRANAQGSTLSRDLATALVEAKERVTRCEVCQNFSTEAICTVCADSRRDRVSICVVEQVQDLRAIESTGVFRGTYHVLHGAIAPLDGVGPEQLHLDSLLTRLKSGQCREIVLATNASVEGDATALYIAQMVRPLGILVTKLAAGIPLGGEIEYVDLATLGRALRERRELNP